MKMGFDFWAELFGQVFSVTMLEHSKDNYV